MEEATIADIHDRRFGSKKLLGNIRGIVLGDNDNKKR